jgi:hypothetical protein
MGRESWHLGLCTYATSCSNCGGHPGTGNADSKPATRQPSAVACIKKYCTLTIVSGSR